MPAIIEPIFHLHTFHGTPEIPKEFHPGAALHVHSFGRLDKLDALTQLRESNKGWNFFVVFSQIITEEECLRWEMKQLPFSVKNSK